MPDAIVVTPNAAFLDGHIPTITLAGQEWPVPVLGPRQNRIVGPNLLSLLPKFAGFSAKDLKGDAAKIGALLARLDTPAYDLLSDAVFFALTKAHPLLTRSMFDDMPIETLELIYALSTLAKQSGLFKDAPQAPTAAPLVPGKSVPISSMPGSQRVGEEPAGDSQIGTN